MPASPIFDIDKLDMGHIVADHAQIYSVLPHRYEFERLTAILHCDDELMVGYHDLGHDEFWVKGHIPGRPLFPGVMMIETAAQLVSYAALIQSKDRGGFLGFAAVDGVKFRGSVLPGQRLVMMAKMVEFRPRRCIADTQGFVDGKMVFEGRITGMWL